MWAVFEERAMTQADSHDFKIRVGLFAVELVDGMSLIPCSEHPSAFFLRGIVDSRDAAWRLIEQIENMPVRQSNSKR